MENTILKSIDANYLLEMYDIQNKKIESIITIELLTIAQEEVLGNFNEYIKSHHLENQIKQAGLQYFFSIYFMIKFGIPKNINKKDSVKTKLREFITLKNNLTNLSQDLPNFDFYLGSCGIKAQNIAIKKDANL